jgi:hypothetical protein
MQSYKQSPSGFKAAGIDSKIAAPSHSVPKAPNEQPIKAAGGSVKGFSGGVINPKVSC